MYSCMLSFISSRKMIYWKLSNNKYEVMFLHLHAAEVKIWPHVFTFTSCGSTIMTSYFHFSKLRNHKYEVMFSHLQVAEAQLRMNIDLQQAAEGQKCMNIDLPQQNIHKNWVQNDLHTLRKYKHEVMFWHLHAADIQIWAHVLTFTSCGHTIMSSCSDIY